MKRELFYFKKMYGKFGIASTIRSLKETSYSEALCYKQWKFIVNIWSKSSAFEDFEITVERGAGVKFGADSGSCSLHVRILGPKQNLDHRSFFFRDRYGNEFI